MSDTGWTNPGAAANDSSVGTVAWSNVPYVLTDNANVASIDINYHDDAYDKHVRIVKGGVISSTNLAPASPNAWNYEGETIYGSSTNLWGETWVASDINSSGFGFVISFQDGYTLDISNYLKVNDFGFSVPSAATINGIEVKVDKGSENPYPSAGDIYAWVGNIQIKVYYTESSGGPQVGTKYPLPAFSV